MSDLDYRSPIKISNEDPICSSSSMQGTVIGVLFDKTGAEIKEALGKRIKVIDKKIGEYEESIEGVNDFIKDKRSHLKRLDEYYTERVDKKGVLLKPFEKNVTEINERFAKKIKNLSDNFISDVKAVKKACQGEVETFDEETHGQVGKIAVDFEANFDDFQDKFKEFDTFYRAEREDINGLGGVTGAQGVGGETGLLGCTGASGPIGPQGLQGLFHFGDGNVGVGEKPLQALTNNALSEANQDLDFSLTGEDRSLARITLLRARLAEYIRKVDVVKSKIRRLDDEKRRLSLIQRNISPDRSFRLDLNKLSAFGFEDLEIN